MQDAEKKPGVFTPGTDACICKGLGVFSLRWAVAVPNFEVCVNCAGKIKILLFDY